MIISRRNNFVRHGVLESCGGKEGGGKFLCNNLEREPIKTLKVRQILWSQ